MSHDMRFPTMWYVQPAKQISLHVHTVWSEPLLGTLIFYECSATDWKSFEVSKLKRRLHRLVWIYTCQNAILLEITCHGSNVFERVLLNHSLAQIQDHFTEMFLILSLPKLPNSSASKLNKMAARAKNRSIFTFAIWKKCVLYTAK